MKDSFVCRFPLENIPEETVTVFSDWEENNFSLKILHRGNAWEKNVSSDEVQSMSSETRLQPKEYISETKRALTSEEGMKHFTYTLLEGEFSWKKICKEFKVKFGCVILEKAPISRITDALIEFMMHQKTTLEKRTKELEEENSQLKMVNCYLQEEMKTLVDSKNQMEESLYSKFTRLLNAKKEKIEMLEKEILKGKKNSNSNKTKLLRAGKGGNDEEMEQEEEKSEAQGESSDEYGGETQIDEDYMAPSSSKIRRIESPVTAPRNIDFEDISEDSCHSDYLKRTNEDTKDEAKTSVESHNPSQTSQPKYGKLTIHDLLNDM